MAIPVFHYPACDTCRRALKWLDARGVEVERIHIVDAPPSREAIEDLWRRSELPLKRFFNTAGQSYRNGDFKSRLPEMSESEQLDALAADGKLIKRPLVDAGDVVLVGFKEADYEARLP